MSAKHVQTKKKNEAQSGLRALFPGFIAKIWNVKKKQKQKNKKQNKTKQKKTKQKKQNNNNKKKKKKKKRWSPGWS